MILRKYTFMRNIIFSIIEKCRVNIAKIYIHLYEKKLRSRIKNKDFTILASNCAAGIFYHRLGHKFLSPTINMWFRQDDFIKFCCDLKHYISCELVFINEEEYDYPVAKLDDIYLYFNHAKTKDEATENWNKRKSRINYDNLYILLYDRGNVSKEEYLRLNDVNCKNKVVFTPNKEFDLDFAYYIKPNLNRPLGDSYLDRDWLTLRTLEKEFDFVSWLNNELVF